MTKSGPQEDATDLRVERGLLPDHLLVEVLRRWVHLGDVLGDRSDLLLDLNAV